MRPSIRRAVTFVTPARVTVEVSPLAEYSPLNPTVSMFHPISISMLNLHYGLYGISPLSIPLIKLSLGLNSRLRSFGVGFK